MIILGIELDDLELNRIGQWPLPIRIVLLLCIFSTTMAFGAFWILHPHWEGLKKVRQEKLDLQLAFKQTHHQVSHLTEYQKQLLIIKKNLDILTQQLPSKKEEAKILEDISQYAMTSDLKLLGIKPHPEEHKAFYVEHPIEISLLGDFHGFGKFISSISNMSRIISTHDFSISKDKGSDYLRITVTAKSYRSLESLGKETAE
jgi:type IV pilus assembly protein PilO